MGWRPYRALRLWCRAIAKRLLRTAIEQVVRDAALKRPGEQPTVLAIRLRDYDLAVRNINRLASELAHAMIPPSEAPADLPPVHPLGSEMCKQRDFESPWVRFWLAELREPFRLDRKLWEFCFIAQALHGRGMLQPGRTGLGFGCGAEPLPSLFAKYGAAVVATDVSYGAAAQAPPLVSYPHPAARDASRRPDICPEDKLANITARPLDMSMIPPGLSGGFDFCWSSCALEHLGSIARGLDFVERSLDMLKPGGVAVHTTEFVLDEDATVDHFDTVLFGEGHLRAIADRVRGRGCTLAALDFDRGDGILDRLPALATLSPDVEAERDLARIKISLTGFACTSFGLIIQRDGG